GVTLTYKDGRTADIDNQGNVLLHYHDQGGKQTEVMVYADGRIVIAELTELQFGSEHDIAVYHVTVYDGTQVTFDGRVDVWPSTVGSTPENLLNHLTSTT